MKRLILTSCILSLVLLSGCSQTEAASDNKLVKVAKDNIKKAAEYHKLSNAAKISSAHVQGFVADWVEECKALAKVTGQPLQLQMGDDGDPGCTAPKNPQPQASSQPQGRVENPGTPRVGPSSK